MKRFLMITAALMIAAAPAVADIVRVECIGEVEFTQVSFGEFADVISGDPVIATFLANTCEGPTGKEYVLPRAAGWSIRLQK